MKVKIKSVSTRYMLIFMAVMVVIVIIMGVIITTIVSSFSLDTKMKDMYDVNRMFNTYYDEVEKKDKTLYGTLKDSETDLNKMLGLIFINSPYCDVLIFDLNGELVMYASQEENGMDLLFNTAEALPSVISRSKLPEHIIDRILMDDVLSRSDNCDGYFSKEVVHYASVLRDDEGEALGVVMSYDRGDEEGDLIFDMLIAIVITVIWITVAALVAIYGISYRIMRPLREIGKAARSFSKGNFNIKVPVRGEDELAELADSFNKMAAALYSKDEMQKNFLSNVSHDLRTPMTTIAGFIDSIIDGAIPPEKQDYYLNIIKNEVTRLSRLVGSLLDISRMQSGERQFDIKNFNICELARQTIISFENQFEEKKLEVEFNCDDYDMIAKGDKDAINQVIYNLCHNAIKFAYDGGKYIVNIVSKGNKIEFSMYNDGIGITEDDLPHVFERFYKSDKSRGLDKTGVGLGLFITKTIIDAHGESISVESEYGKYCKFTFTLSKGEMT